jgi:hypothetical protein
MVFINTDDTHEDCERPLTGCDYPHCICEVAKERDE